MNSFRLVTPYFKENKYKIILGVWFLILVDLFQLFIPRIIKWTIDDLTYSAVAPRQLMKYAGYIILAAVGICVCRYYWRRFLIGTSRRVEEGLRNQIFHHLQRLSATYFNTTTTGELMAHATNDVTNIRMATGMGMVALTDAVFLGTAAIGFMLYINVTLTCYALLPMPFLILCARYFSRKMHHHFQRVQASFGDMTEVIREKFAGIRVVKSQTLEAPAYEAVNRTSREYVRRNIALTRITGAFFPLMILFTNISLAIVIYLGGRQAITTTITTGDFVAFINYLSLMTWPMMAVGWVISLIQRGKASLDRINKIMETRSDIEDLPDAVSMTEPPDAIRFENVSFAYDTTRQPVLSGIDLSIPRGMILGITGPPGSGKTTLLNLLPRIFDPTTGHIRFDNTDIRHINCEDVRHLMSYVGQEPFLFSGTISENITFTTGHSEDQRLVDVAAHASLTETIREFPDGFETIVGEKGVVLSGGQKQRIAIARALYPDTPILILDDPVSQVDAETGRAVMQAILDNARNKTIIIVSHRLSTIKNADRIIVLDQGRIRESGTHETLSKEEGYYARMLKLQELEADLN